MKKKLALLLALLTLAAAVTGCGAQEGEASVQSVSMICGLGATGLADRFAGMVTPQGETKIEKDGNNQVSAVKVAVGDEVEEGQVLFTYDTAQLSLDLEKTKLELERMKSDLESQKKSKESLEREKADAPGDYETQTQYSLDIREAEAQIQETTFNIALKEKDVQRLQESLKNTSVTSPCTGRIQSINENESYDDMGNPLPFMTIVQTDGYRVKGYVNEANAYALGEGTQVIVRSRVNEATWTGTISLIEWDNPQQNQNYYGESDTALSSRYPFYVELTGSGGLLLGQHVYIEPDYGQEAQEDADTIHLPAYYIVDADTNPYVWAQSKSGKLEKRSVTLGDYDMDMDTYVVESGLTAEDYIAFPDDTLKPGMTCVPYDEAAFAPGDADDGAYFPEEEYTEEIFPEENAAEEVPVMDASTVEQELARQAG